MPWLLKSELVDLKQSGLVTWRSDLLRNTHLTCAQSADRSANPCTLDIGVHVKARDWPRGGKLRERGERHQLGARCVPNLNGRSATASRRCNTAAAAWGCMALARRSGRVGEPFGGMGGSTHGAFPQWRRRPTTCVANTAARTFDGAAVAALCSWYPTPVQVADFGIDDYIEIVRHVRIVEEDTTKTVRRLVRARRADAGATLAGLVQADTLHPIVLVAPSGTGKTTEFRQLARRLRASGRAAAFAEAAGIVASPEMDLDTDERVAFRHLLESQTPGVLFVDALDELYLRQQSLEQLFRRLEREVGFEAHPTRLIFSARNGAWTSSSTRELRRLLQRIDAVPKVVAFEPLDLPAIRKLAASYNVDNVDEFMSEFEEEEIDELLDLRPADVKLLVELRRRGGKLSKWTQLLQEYIDATFIDARPARNRGQRLSMVMGRRGLQRSAAATMLINVPHISASNVSLPTGAICSRRLFPDWSASELAEFLEHPLFAHKGGEAEAVQLPQGPLSYFLAARWFAERVRHGLPAESLRDALLVRGTGDRFEIPQAHRRVVGWLSSEVLEFRRLIARDHPSVVLYEGDPDRLADSEVRTILEHLCEAIALSQWDGWATPATMRRLARPSLEADVKALLKRYKSTSKVAVQVLRLVEYGRYRTCSDLALEIAGGPDDSLARPLAISAFAAVAPDLRAKLLALKTSNDDYVRRALLLALVPDLLQGEALRSFVITGGKHVFRQGLNEVAERIATPDLDAVLTALVPVLSSSTVNTATTRAFSTAVPIIRSRLGRGGACSADLIEVLSAIERLRHDRMSMNLTDDDVRSLNSLLERNTEARRALWTRRFQAAAQSSHSFENIQHPRFGDVGPGDLEWLWNLISQSKEEGGSDVLLVLHRGWSCVPAGERDRVFDGLSIPELKAQIASWAEVERGLAQKLKEREEKERAEDEAARKSNEETLAARRPVIESGDDLDALVWGWQHLEGDHAEDARLSPERLRRYVGDEYVTIFLRGLRACWRKIDVPVPEPGGGRQLRYLIGLTGLTLAVRAGLDLLTLRPEEVRRAARFGLYEVNSFPFWYSDLARAYPDEVRDALWSVLALEWAHTAEAHGILRFASRSDAEVSDIIRALVLDLLEIAPPKNATTVGYAADAILTSINALPRVISIIRRVIDRAEDAMPDPNWCRIWAHVEPEAAADWFSSQMERRPDAVEPVFLKTAALLEQDLDERFGSAVATSLMAPRALGRWTRLLLSVVKPKDDVRHSGAYSPGDRDHAEDLRRRCMTRLASSATPEARSVLLEFQKDPRLADVHTIVDQLLKRQQDAAVEASVIRWNEEDVVRLEQNDEKLPRSLEELFELVKAHLLHVHDLIANDDFSYRNLFTRRGDSKEAAREREIQLWVASCLRQRARGLYSVVRENVVDDDKEVDISAFAAGIGHVPIEIKPLGPYSATALEKIVENQLLGQYMQPPDRRCGILLLVRRDNRKWRLGGKQVTLPGLVEHLRAHARVLGSRHGKDIFVAVVDLLADSSKGYRDGYAVAEPRRMKKSKARQTRGSGRPHPRQRQG